jgi:hypothetical protein
MALREGARPFDALPEPFRTILSAKGVLAEDETALEQVLVERNSVAADQAACLVMATTYGLVVLREGSQRISEDFYGYNVVHVLYEGIAGFSLDACLLRGELRVFVPGSAESVVVEFNTARCHGEFERLVAAVRREMVGRARRPQAGPA